MNTDEFSFVPFQVQKLIEDMLNNKENIHVRSNYRSRLVQIRDVIDRSVRVYDNELGKANATLKTRKHVRK